MMLSVCCAGILGSCVGPHWSEQVAQDRIMLVRGQPPSLGHRRLVYQAAVHPQLASFLTKSGQPDFIAETSSGDRQYLILYYLRSGNAYACRTWRDPRRSIEFAGPYPMTEKERQVLGELQRGVLGVPRPEMN